MTERVKPVCVHRTLLLEQWTALGAQVECLDCVSTFHIYLHDLEGQYADFEHKSGREGPTGDRTLFLRWEELI